MKYSEVLKKLWVDFKISYEDVAVFKWSVWWSLSLCGYVLVINFGFLNIKFPSQRFYF